MQIYDDADHALVVIDKNGNRTDYDLEKIQTNDNQTKSGVIDSFIDCLENNRNSEISGESVITAMRAIFASIESSLSGRTVKVYH